MLSVIALGFNCYESLFSLLPRELIIHILQLSQDRTLFLAQANTLGYKDMEKKEELCMKLDRYLHSRKRRLVIQGLTGMQRCFLYRICGLQNLRAEKVSLSLGELNDICPHCEYPDTDDDECDDCGSTRLKRCARVANIIITNP